ncbi:MAG: hypothetical protein GDA43_02000 [Hormoscilla sp. SP5CHS1]|nr:hypothetical protein [Hormoscilla sp. SP12CHS1]MBC6452110.1 hypothetical protein [Hormoscilla sp. SP5CHS1]
MINNQPEPPSNPDRQKSGLQNSDSAQEELRILKEENSRLRKQIKELDTLEELFVYRVTFPNASAKRPRQILLNAPG